MKMGDFLHGNVVQMKQLGLLNCRGSGHPTLLTDVILADSEILKMEVERQNIKIVDSVNL